MRLSARSLIALCAALLTLGGAAYAATSTDLVQRSPSISSVAPPTATPPAPPLAVTWFVDGKPAPAPRLARPAVQDGRVRLAPPSEVPRGAVMYRVFRKRAGSRGRLRKVGGARVGRDFVDRKLAPGSYRYRAAAVNDAGQQSKPSRPVTAVVPGRS